MNKGELKKVFVAMKRGVRELQADLARGDTAAVDAGLQEFLAALEEMEKNWPPLLPDDAI